VDVYSTEEQQVEALKNWWKKNGKSVIGGVIIGIALVAGGRTWFSYQDRQAEAASIQYDAMMAAMGQGKNEDALQIGGQLLGKYSDTPYGEMAALASAKIKMEQGDLTAAQVHLQWLLANADNDEIKQIARIRSARILLGEGKHQDALDILQQADADTFTSTVEDLKGDIYTAIGQVEKARTAYNMALNALEPAARGRNFIQMKLDDLGGAKMSGEK
jgi:predicted negative regulator of RcsB-dependent stress response